MNKEELIKLIETKPNDYELGCAIRDWYWKETKCTTKPYRPLPDVIKVGESKIEGSGLISQTFLQAGTELGVSHVHYPEGEFHSDYIRTPLGGFTNHSTTPNCEFYECGNYLKMRTLVDIKEGEELTANYTLYKPCQNYV
tara:strand:- start:138 stop:557 length:420 start_codon:yes stop_codon:yes gene_type:complete